MGSSPVLSDLLGRALNPEAIKSYFKTTIETISTIEIRFKIEEGPRRQPQEYMEIF